MSAICDPCGWTGTVLAVVDGGRCPECKAKIRYEFTPLPSVARRVTSIHDFNQRAKRALEALPSMNPFVEAIAAKIGAGRSLTDREQQALFNTVNSKHRQIHDTDLTEYALKFARGAD